MTREKEKETSGRRSLRPVPTGTKPRYSDGHPRGPPASSTVTPRLVYPGSICPNSTDRASGDT